MRRLLALAFAVSMFTSPALASGDAAPASPPPACADRIADARGAIQLAQSDCRGSCSSSRGYRLSTCRDSFCRAVCNDRYQSCLSSCRR
jgi:hypothetical protein